MDPLKPESADVDRLIRQAHVHKMRGENARAAELIQQAAEIDPTNANVWELRGDLLFDMGKLEEARDAYQKALDAQPGRATADKKHANAVFLMHERAFQRQQIEDMVLHPELARKGTVQRKPAISVIASLLIPGAGQIYNGQYIKGGIVLGIGVVIFLFALLDPALSSFVKSLAGILNPKKASVQPDFWMLFVLFVDLLLYIYALADSAVVGTRLGKLHATPARPMPLSEFDSEPPNI